MPAARRCSFWHSQNRQCASPGHGNPPLCAKHDFAEEDGELDEDQRWNDDPVLGAVVDRIMDHPSARDLFGRVSTVIDGFANVIDQMSGHAPPPPPPKWARPQPPPRAAPPPRRPPPPPPLPPARATGPDPRKVLGIPPGAALTRRLIKDRQRALAMKHHPDRGGSTASMQRINDAATELLKQVGG